MTTVTDCQMCGGECFFLGTLGNLDWFRCRNCGAEFGDPPESEMEPTPLESSPDAAAEWTVDARMAEAADRGPEAAEFTESPEGYRAREKWARAYDDLNGAPEGDDDR